MRIAPAIWPIPVTFVLLRSHVGAVSTSFLFEPLADIKLTSPVRQFKLMTNKERYLVYEICIYVYYTQLCFTVLNMTNTIKKPWITVSSNEALFQLVALVPRPMWKRSRNFLVVLVRIGQVSLPMACSKTLGSSWTWIIRFYFCCYYGVCPKKIDWTFSILWQSGLGSKHGVELIIKTCRIPTIEREKKTTMNDGSWFSLGSLNGENDNKPRYRF